METPATITSAYSLVNCFYLTLIARTAVIPLQMLLNPDGLAVHSATFVRRRRPGRQGRPTDRMMAAAERRFPGAIIR